MMLKYVAWLNHWALPLLAKAILGSVVHYAPQNLCPKKPFNKDLVSKRMPSGKNPCYKFNRESGCDQSEEC